jgi:GNAT superfamily N-acetyltransferase
MSIHAEKPTVIEVKVEKAKEIDVPVIARIYDQWRMSCKGCKDTFVAKNDLLGIVGAITIKENRYPFPEVGTNSVELLTICVDKQYRKKDIGKQLIKGVIDAVREDERFKEIHKIVVQVKDLSPDLKHILEDMGFRVEERGSRVESLGTLTEMSKYF